MSRRWLWIVLAMALGVAALAGAAWHAFPRIVRPLALRQIEALTGRHATVDDFALDLVHGRLDITGFRLDDRAPGPPLAEFERLSARFKSRGLLRGRLHVTEAVLERPRLRIARGAAGEFNIEDLLAPTAGRGRWPGVI